MEKKPEGGGQEDSRGQWGILTEETGKEEPKRNVRAEWEALQEQAKAENFAADAFEEYEEDPDKERKRKIGRRLMMAVELLSESVDDEKLQGRVDRIYRMAELAGKREELEKDVKRHMANDYEAPGRKPYGTKGEAPVPTGLSEEEKAGLSEEERARVEVAEKAEQLKAEAMELKGADLSVEFPSGTYLFHSADVEHVGQILTLGKLMNAIAVMENTDADSLHASANSGGEGISWSMNGIDALPGTRGHIAGFLAAPEAVLGAQDEDGGTGETKLVIPSRPAPYEVLQVSEGMDGKAFFEAKKQVEVWGDRSASFTDKASVEANLLFLGMQSQFSTSLLAEYAERGGLPAEKLREHFSVDENGKVKLNEQLHQQKFDENFVPPGAVYLQSLIDRGKAKEVLGLPEDAEVPDVNSIIGMLKENKELRFKMVREARGESEEILQKYNEEWEKAKGIELPISEMYFVCSHGDLDAWTKVLAGAGQKPKGILLYDDKQVVLPNFASPYKGNHGELTAEIGKAVKVNSEFWKSEMGIDVESLERAGSQGQVLREEDVRHDQEIKMVDGELKLETVS